jgi:hypothetical protein
MNSDDRAFTGTYIRVILVEAIILVVLWLVGRAFS